MKSLDPVRYSQTATLLSDQIDRTVLAVILRELAKTADISGDVVEFGCFAGTTSVHIARWLENSDKNFHVYDSFAGLPEKTTPDISPAGEQFKAGELAVTKKQFIINCKKAGVRLPVIHKGWFSDLDEQDVPEQISFAFLDGDYYESVRVPLKLIEHKLTSGAVVVVDDYANEALPGAARAVDEWRRQTDLDTMLRVEHSLAIIQVRIK